VHSVEHLSQNRLWHKSKDISFSTHLDSTTHVEVNDLRVHFG
jgi:hypothetical protein